MIILLVAIALGGLALTCVAGLDPEGRGGGSILLGLAIFVIFIVAAVLVGIFT